MDFPVSIGNRSKMIVACGPSLKTVAAGDFASKFADIAPNCHPNRIVYAFTTLVKLFSVFGSNGFRHQRQGFISVTGFLGTFDGHLLGHPAVTLVVGAENPPTGKEKDMTFERPVMILPDLHAKGRLALRLSLIFIKKDHFNPKFIESAESVNSQHRLRSLECSSPTSWLARRGPA